MTLPDASPSLSLRERLFNAALTDVDYRLATRDDAHELALLFEMAFNESGFPSRGIRYSVPKAEAWLRQRHRQRLLPASGRGSRRRDRRRDLLLVGRDVLRGAGRGDAHALHQSRHTGDRRSAGLWSA